MRRETVRGGRCSVSGGRDTWLPLYRQSKEADERTKQANITCSAKLEEALNRSTGHLASTQRSGVLGAFLSSGCTHFSWHTQSKILLSSGQQTPLRAAFPPRPAGQVRAQQFGSLVCFRVSGLDGKRLLASKASTTNRGKMTGQTPLRKATGKFFSL